MISILIDVYLVGLGSSFIQTFRDSAVNGSITFRTSRMS